MAIVTSRASKENSKSAKAKAIYEQMMTDKKEYSRKDVLTRFMTEAELTEAGAATYYYNITKEAKKVANKVAK